jgi:hypothetical protein
VIAAALVRSEEVRPRGGEIPAAATMTDEVTVSEKVPPANGNSNGAFVSMGEMAAAFCRLTGRALRTDQERVDFVLFDRIVHLLRRKQPDAGAQLERISSLLNRNLTERRWAGVQLVEAAIRAYHSTPPEAIAELERHREAALSAGDEHGKVLAAEFERRVPLSAIDLFAIDFAFVRLDMSFVRELFDKARTPSGREDGGDKRTSAYTVFAEMCLSCDALEFHQTDADPSYESAVDRAVDRLKKCKPKSTPHGG